MPVVDNFIADLKDAVQEAKLAPDGQGTMVMLYGACPVPVPFPSRSRVRVLVRVQYRILCG